jgi:hypothetical protein
MAAPITGSVAICSSLQGVYSGADQGQTKCSGLESKALGLSHCEGGGSRLFYDWAYRFPEGDEQLVILLCIQSSNGEGLMMLSQNGGLRNA